MEKFRFLDSEQSYEAINSTMMCVFLLFFSWLHNLLYFHKQD